MDSSDAGAGAADASNRRKSGRVTHGPVRYDPDLLPNGSAKRKRDSAAAAAHDGDDGSDDASSEDDDDDAHDPDDEELKDRRRRSGGTGAAKKKKPAAKKPKVAGQDGVSLAMRPAANGVKRAAKPKKARARRGATGAEADTLYAQVFLAETAPDQIAAAWTERYRRSADDAMCELVNFVLKCAGCSLSLTAQDIGDPDNAAYKLTELQEEFQAQKPTDYPLISRAKTLDFSKDDLERFLSALVASVHAAELVYREGDALVSNLQVWVSSMSSSPMRAFRHTATLVALCIGNEVCRVIQEIGSSAATTTRQKEAEEKKKKNVNKARVATLTKTVKEIEAKNQVAESWIRDIYTTVFVHRYRDVDWRIRHDCITSVGFWIHTCPDLFFEGSTLRYLGWLLSDSAAVVRAEVVRQLSRLYKPEGNVGRLRAFTDKFRPRMVEMATRDADTGIRASTIGLLDLIRRLGLLEPDDIDAIGRMIFDTEPKIRDRVGNFFAESISDVLEGAVEELGGDDTLDEALGNELEDEYDSPRREWLRLKCLAEVIGSYDEDQSEAEPQPVSDILVAAATQSRYSLAADAVCRGVDEARDWQVIAGYLLYDNTSTGTKTRRADPLESFKRRCQLNEQQERLLLEILDAAVKSSLAEANEQEHDRKKTKAEKNKARSAQEEAAVRLASIIPRLLKKFGAQPDTASPVLRLEHVLNLAIFQEMRQDSAEFASLLDDINRQFLTHADQSVLAEASTAILHAREFEDLEEVTETKLQELWDGTISTLRQLTRAKVPKLSSLASTVSRIANLASVSDCTDALELEPRIASKAKSSTPTKALEILLDLIRGYGAVPDPDADTLVSNAMQAVLLYYLWVFKALQDKVNGKTSIDELPNYDDFTGALIGVMDQRPKLDEIRLRSIAVLLDLHTSFAALRGVEHSSQEAELASLVKEVPAKAERLILQSFVAAERDFAKKSSRTLATAEESELPEEPDSEPEESSEDEADDGDEAAAVAKSQRRAEDSLRAESKLLEISSKIVIATIGRVLDCTGPNRGQLTKRISVNKTKLGSNFKEVLGYLEAPGSKRSHQKGKGQQATKQPQQPAKSAEVVEEEDDSDDGGEEEGAGEEEDHDEGAEASDDPDHGGEGMEVEMDDVIGD